MLRRLITQGRPPRWRLQQQAAKRNSLLAALGAGALAGCSPLVIDLSDAELDKAEDLILSGGPPADTSNAVAGDADAARLGQWLFYSSRLSGDGTVSCATCHLPEHGFADTLALSEGVGTTARHAPSLLGAAYNRWQFWDGRADSLWAQALGPLENPAEHGSSRLQAAHVVADDPQVAAAYAQVFGPLPDLSDPARFPAAGYPAASPSDPLAQAWAGMTTEDQHTINVIFSNIGKAIEAYERLLEPGTSRVDTFLTALLAGEREGLSALSAQEQHGLQLFVGRANCTRCHFGPTLSNREFHNIGLGARPWMPQGDVGRYVGLADVLADPFNGAGAYSDDPTGPPADKLAYLSNGTEQLGQYKTPSLRNVGRTAPYMHGGHFETLDEVLSFYSTLDEDVVIGHREESLVPLDLSDDEHEALRLFLLALDGQELDPALLQAPASPQRGR